MDSWDIFEKDLLVLWNDFCVEYTVRYADEPLCDLTMEEAGYLIENTEFSKKTKYNRCIRIILKMHCIGKSDRQISEGLAKLNININENRLRQIRFKALKKITEKFGSRIGLITARYEAFHE